MPHGFASRTGSAILRCAPFVIVARQFSGALVGSASLLPVVRPCPPPVLPGSEFAAKPQGSREHVAFFSSVRPPTWHQQIPRPRRKPDSGTTTMADALTGSAVAAAGARASRPTAHRYTSRHHIRGHQPRQLRQLRRRIKRSLAAARGNRSSPFNIEGDPKPASDAACLLLGSACESRAKAACQQRFVSIPKTSRRRLRFDPTRSTNDTVACSAQIRPLQMTTARPGHRRNRGARWVVMAGHRC
jgi:hypothetical protein